MSYGSGKVLTILAIAAFLVGVITIALGMLLDASKRTFGFGWLLFVCSYFLVVLENLISGRPVRTRRGWVDRKTYPVKYFSIYIFLTMIALVAAMTFLGALVLE